MATKQQEDPGWTLIPAGFLLVFVIVSFTKWQPKVKEPKPIPPEIPRAIVRKKDA